MILVTGGTGFIGKYLVRLLLEQGEPVRILTRNTETLQKSELKYEYVAGDLRDKASLETACKGVNEVYHLAAIFRHGIGEKLIWEVNYQGTINLLEAALSKGVKKFIYISTVGVMGHANGHPLNENSPYNPNPNAYSKSKAKTEQELLKIAKKEGIDLRIIRPAFVYGPGGEYGVGLVIKNVIEGKLKWVIGSGNNYIHPIHVWDLVRAFELIRKKGRSGEVYIVANEKPTRLKDFLNLVASFAGVRVRYGFPPMLAYLILKIKGGIGGATPKETILAFTKNWFYKIDKLKTLGWRQEIPLEKGAKETVEWFIKKG